MSKDCVPHNYLHETMFRQRLPVKLKEQGVLRHLGDVPDLNLGHREQQIELMRLRILLDSARVLLSRGRWSSVLSAQMCFSFS
jgi:hypothetical protein